MKSPPPLSFIRSFECAARHLSFTEASKELGLSQSAVSSQIRALEQYIGQQLFHRYPRSIKLTEVGEAFLPNLRQALLQIDNATEAILIPNRNKTVVICCPVSIAERWLMDVVAGFRRQHPRIEIVVHGTIWGDLGDNVADLTISVHREDETITGATKLWGETLMLVGAPELLASSAVPFTAADLAKYDRISILGREEYWQIMADAIGMPVAGQRKSLAVNANNLALALAESGAGLVVAPQSLALAKVKQGVLVEPVAVRPKSNWAYYLFERQAVKGSAASKVKQWLLAHLPNDIGGVSTS